MIIKKFQAKTEEEALTLAKKELGEGVVVMNVRAVKPTGFFKWFKTPNVEVTVAKEEESEILQSKARVESERQEQLEDMIASVDRLRILSENESKPKENEFQPQKTETPLQGDTFSKRIQGTDDTALEERLESIQNLLEEKLRKQETEEKGITLEENGKENGEMMEFIRLLYNTMIDNEVHEKYANQMIDEIEQNFDVDTQMEYILSHIYQKMILKFGKVERITPSEKKGPKAVFFIGPTGVGKTTTLAKIASQLCLTENKKVALFTADTYRIAATDQLKTYANILGAPFHIIYSVEEMKKYYENYRDYDYILVDTAGHSHHNDEQRKNMNEFIHAFEGVLETEVYLVLSATTKYRDLISIADTYSEMTKYKIIFTKLDETTTYGNILNLRIHTEAPLSYVTYGQNVPDDIALFDPQDTVKKLLSGAN